MLATRPARVFLPRAIRVRAHPRVLKQHIGPASSESSQGSRPTPYTCLFSTTSSLQVARENPSVDPLEVSHFNALASSWWDAHGPSRLLHLMNPLRHQFIDSCLAQSSPYLHDPSLKLRILDVGCGGGIFAESAARLSQIACVTAIDPSSEVLAIAKAHQRRDPLLMQPGRLEYKNAAIENLPTPSNESEQYDIVTLFEVLEHVTNPSAFLGEVIGHVKPGGWFICSTIARTWISWFTTKLVAEDLAGIVPRGTHDWSKYINEYELQEWFQKRPGWDLPRALGVVYVPGIGWKEITGSQKMGNYFFGIRRTVVD